MVLLLLKVLRHGLPIIVITPLPGHEEENALFVENNGIGIWIRKNDNVKEKLHSILTSPEKMKNMKIQARLTAKKNSTKDICSTLLAD